MKIIKSYIKKKTTPARLLPKDGIRYWQEKVLLTILMASVFLGFFTWLPSVYLAIKEGLWLIAIVDTLIFIFVLYLFFKPSLPYAFRAGSFPVLSYLLGMILLIVLGPFGGGPVWLFFFPILAGVLLGVRSAVMALGLNLITTIVIGLMIQWNLFEILPAPQSTNWQMVTENPLMKWVVVSFNFMLLDTLSTLSVTTILNGLQNSLEGLRTSEKKYRRIFENVLDVYFETTLDGRIIEVSPSIKMISGFDPEKIKGRYVEDFFEKPDQKNEFVNSIRTDGVLNDYQLNLLDKDLRVHCCSLNVKLVGDDKENPEKIIGIFRDITEQVEIAQKQKELEERLNRSQKMEALGLLAGGVAHDLNNVLSGIVTYPDLLLLDMPKENPMHQTLSVIKSSGMRATEIVQDLLTLSRRGVITKELVDVNEIIFQFLRTPEYEKILSFHPHVRVSTRIEADPSFIKGSAVHLQKTVMNLISNAAEAQPDGGVIKIVTKNIHLEKPVSGYDHVLSGDYLVLSVEDEGLGIEEEDMKRIFEPFFTKKVMGRSGTGLGMAVVWGTVQDHDGYIDVISSPDIGTRFDLYLPLSFEKIIVNSGAHDIGKLKGSGETILIVDDVEQQREIAASALERLGYSAVSVPSGEAAVEYLKKNHADVILLDMIMDPGIDGLETYRRIKAFKKDQKAIISSGFSQTEQVKQTMELGAGQYIKKPYTVHNIGKAIKKELNTI